MKTENIITGNRKLVEMISVSEIRKPKIFRRERAIGANYFGFRISETENFRKFSAGNRGKFSVSEIRKPKIFRNWC